MLWTPEPHRKREKAKRKKYWIERGDHAVVLLKRGGKIITRRLSLVNLADRKVRIFNLSRLDKISPHCRLFIVRRRVFVNHGHIRDIFSYFQPISTGCGNREAPTK
jgi:hypothetical protein